MNFFRNRFKLFALTSCILACAAGLLSLAQDSNGGTIKGLITGANGSPVSNATVTATDNDTGVQTSRQTNASGSYSISPIRPGPYSVEVVAPGFERLLQERVNVVAAKTIDMNLTLPHGFEGRPGPVRPVTELEMATDPGNRTALQVVTDPGKPTAAAVPLFRDPIHDGAADPVVVYNRARKTWWMFYTNRRADLDDNSGVTWVHGTHIGIAESSDGGTTWHYVSEADIPVAAPDYTLWAPEVIDVDGTYHMFLTVVPGTFTDWKHPRHIQHLTSKDLLHWTPLADANLQSESTIDACVFRLPSGNWRLWYKNEADGSKVYFSDSPDLVHWTHKGIATTNHGEGPVVFQWHGAYWLINDPHQGLGVFRSDDLTTWKQQPNNILREPGTQETDKAVGNHADVVIDATGRAWLFYFTQQGGENASANTKGYGRHSVLHVTEFHEKDGIITVDRNSPAYIHLFPPPKNKKSDDAKAW